MLGMCGNLFQVNEYGLRPLYYLDKCPGCKMKSPRSQIWPFKRLPGPQGKVLKTGTRVSRTSVEALVLATTVVLQVTFGSTSK